METTHKKRIHSATDTFKEIAVYYVLLLVVSATIFSYAEGRDFWSSFYWAGVTATSTGYGDISPVTVVGRIVAFVLMHVSVLVFGPLIVIRLMDHLHHDEDEFSHEEQEEIRQKLDLILANSLQDGRERKDI